MKLDELEALAKAATPGPWHAPGLAELHDETHRTIGVFSDCDPVDDAERPVPTVDEGDRNAAFIAATNPEAVLRLVAVAKAANDGLEALEMHTKAYPHMAKGYTVDAITALRAALAELETL